MEDVRAGLHRVTTPPPACLHARPVDWGERDQGRQADRVNAAKFGLPVLVTALAVVAAVLSSRLSERLRIPAPAFFLFAAAAAASLWPRLGGLSFAAVEDIVSVALAVILFDGGLRVGWRRLRAVAGPTLWIGVPGTLITAAGVAVAAHLVLAPASTPRWPAWPRSSRSPSWA
jgi:hypothetical protein